MAQADAPQPSLPKPKKPKSCLGKGCFGCLGALISFAVVGFILGTLLPEPADKIEIAQPTARPTPAQVLETPEQKAKRLKAAKTLAEQERKKAEENVKQATISQAKLKSKVDSSLAKLRTHYDKVTEVAWYRPKSAPRYSNSRSDLYLSFGIAANAVLPLDLHIQYVGDDWVFMQSVTIKTDSQTYNIPISFQDRKSDNGELSNGEMGVWEWYDTEVTASQMEMLKDIGSSSDVTMRFNGQQYSRDKTISRDEKRAIKQMLESYADAKSYYE